MVLDMNVETAEAKNAATTVAILMKRLNPLRQLLTSRSMESSFLDDALLPYFEFFVVCF